MMNWPLISALLALILLVAALWLDYRSTLQVLGVAAAVAIVFLSVMVIVERNDL